MQQVKSVGLVILFFFSAGERRETGETRTAGEKYKAGERCEAGDTPGG